MPEQRITARIRGTAVLPSVLDIGIAGNNRVDVVTFVWDGTLPAALSGIAGRPYLK